MEFVNEYALLIAVVLPVGVVAGLNVALALSGESGTLLLPMLKPLPPVETGGADATPTASPVQAQSVPANREERLRRAA